MNAQLLTLAAMGALAMALGPDRMQGSGNKLTEDLLDTETIASETGSPKPKRKRGETTASEEGTPKPKRNLRAGFSPAKKIAANEALRQYSEEKAARPEVRDDDPAAEATPTAMTEERLALVKDEADLSGAAFVSDGVDAGALGASGVGLLDWVSESSPAEEWLQVKGKEIVHTTLQCKNKDLCIVKEVGHAPSQDGLETSKMVCGGTKRVFYDRRYPKAHLVAEKNDEFCGHMCVAAPGGCAPFPKALQESKDYPLLSAWKQQYEAAPRYPDLKEQGRHFEFFKGLLHECSERAKGSERDNCCLERCFQSKSNDNSQFAKPDKSFHWFQYDGENKTRQLQASCIRTCLYQ